MSKGPDVRNLWTTRGRMAFAMFPSPPSSPLLDVASAPLCNLGSNDHKEPSNRPPGGRHVKNRSFPLLPRSAPEQPNLSFTLGNVDLAGGGLEK